MVDLFIPVCRKIYNGAAAQLSLGPQQEAGGRTLVARQALLYQVFGLCSAPRGCREPAEHLNSGLLVRLSREAHLDSLTIGFCELRRQGRLRELLFLVEDICVGHSLVQDASIDLDGVIVIELIIAEYHWVMLGACL